SSSDLKEVFEKVSGEDLNQFFQEWTLQYGQPILKIEKEISKNHLQLSIDQIQENLFHFPVEIKLKYTDGSSEIKTFQITRKKETYNIDLQKSLQNIEIDPNVNLLFEPWKAENHS
ncbi:MAG: M1 family peptidase, partial [Gillisia sp.]